MSRLHLITCALISFMPVKFASAADPVEPRLEPDAAVQAKLDALGDNSCCLLEDATIIEDLGDFAKGWHRMKETGPAGRDFTIKMAWMPDRTLWAFHSDEKRWEPIPTEKPWPRSVFGASLEYIPELGGSLWQYRDRTWLFETVKERVVAYMDLARNVFVAIGYGRVWCYRYRDS